MTALCRNCGVLASSPIHVTDATLAARRANPPCHASHTVDRPLDRDAFYATVEKRGHPDLAARPVSAV